MARIAEIDRAILAHLRRNGRMSCVELAKDIGASEKTIRTHMKKMEENGIIRGYTIREGGVGLTALVRIKVLPGAEIGSFASEVRMLSETITDRSRFKSRTNTLTISKATPSRASRAKRLCSIFFQTP